MNTNTTLEEERRALLEQIEASRTVYRRMLSGSDSNADRGIRHSGSAMQRASMMPTIAAGFPRSHTMRWVIAHRWQLAIGVTAAIILFGPGRKLANQPAIGKVRSKVRAIPHSGVVHAVVAAGTKLLSNRTSLRAAGKLAGLLLQWMQQQRTQQQFMKK